RGRTRAAVPSRCGAAESDGGARSGSSSNGRSWSTSATRRRRHPRSPAPTRTGACEMKAAQRLAEWTGSLACDDLPADVVETAKLHLLDTIGCGVAAHALGVAGEGRTAMAELGGDEQASVIGLDGGLPAPNAAFANAMLCHGLDFDDTHSDSVAHVRVVVGPSSIAAGEANGSSGRDVLAA